MGFTIKTIGILGGSELARMAAIAATQMGVRVCVYSPEPDSPASQVVPFTFVGAYSNFALLKEFAACVDVITYDTDDIPLDTIRHLQKFKPVYPDDRVLEITRNPVRQKQFLQEIGIPTTQWAAIARANDIPKAMEDLGLEDVLLKSSTPIQSTRFRKGQDSKIVWKDLKADAVLLEEKQDLSCEISVIIARDLLGQTAFYGPILNEHRKGVLVKSTIPASIPPQLVKKATELTHFLAEAIDLVGVLCVEFFITKDGRLLANHITPHPHPSGNWTIEACLCSQFEQQVRTVCGIQVGSPNRIADASVTSLIGDDIDRLNLYIEMPNAAVHVYGKVEAHEGRKMGHITIIDSKDKIPSNTPTDTAKEIEG